MKFDGYRIYKLTSPNGKIYIGRTSKNNINHRWNSGKAYKKNDILQKDIVKYSWENFKKEILVENLSYEEAKKMEEFYILKYNSINDGYNKNFGDKICKESRQKISNTRKEKGLAKGKNNPMYGVHRYGEKNPNSKKVICLTTGEIFGTIKEGADKYNISPKNISKCIHERQKTAGKNPITGERLTWILEEVRNIE